MDRIDTILFVCRIIVTLFAGQIIKSYLNLFLVKKTTRMLHMLSWIPYLLWQFVILRGSMLPEYLHLFINVILVLVISIFGYYGKWTMKLLFSVLYVTLWMHMEFFISYVFMAYEIDYKVLHLSGAVTSLSLLFLCIKGFQAFYAKRSIRELPQKYNMILLLIPIGSMFVMYTIFMISSEQKNTYNYIRSTVSLLIMLAINVLVFNIYSKLSEELELKRCNTVFQQQMEMHDNYLLEKIATIEELREIRHDMKQNNIYLLELLEKQEYAEISRYLSTMLPEMSSEKMEVARTDNMVIDALINHKCSIARKNNIEFSVDLNIPSELPYANVDLCILIGNALDNAVEAVLRMQDGKGYISVHMKCDYGNLVFTVRNSFDGNIKKLADGNLVTIKEDAQNHGIGMHSMQKVVNRYNGIISTNNEAEEFTLEVLLYAPLKI